VGLEAHIEDSAYDSLVSCDSPRFPRLAEGTGHADGLRMNPEAERLKKRSKQFALDTLALVRMLPATAETRNVGDQLIRSATGTAANYRAACRSRSDADFISKIGVALEEADESALWFEILTEGNTTKLKEAFRLLDEANQLSAIFAQSRLTSIEGMKRRKAAKEERGARVYCKRV
jgi:four helix bundle protein